jgi:hypothetical protein
MGQKYLVADKRVSMRLWTDEPFVNARPYHAIGWIIGPTQNADDPLRRLC